MARFLPVRPENAVEIGENVFCQVNQFKGAYLTHIRLYEPNAVLYVPTSCGVSFNWEYWVMLSDKFAGWRLDMDLDKLEVGTLYGDAKSAVTFDVDPVQGKLVHFELGNRKQIDLSYDQFVRLCDALPVIESFYGQMTCGPDSHSTQQ